MQSSWLKYVRNLAFSVLVLIPLVGCGGGGGGDSASTPAELSNSSPITIAGSVGDGPIVHADIVVRDSRGRAVVTGKSDDQANYFVEVPAGTKFPLTVSATGGRDLVSGDPADFELVALLLEPANSMVNVSPMTTLVSRGAACRPGGVGAKNVEALWSALDTQSSMGFDRALMRDPMRDRITPQNAAAVVYANEGLGEAIRRTHRALQTTSVAASMDDIVRRLACDLADGVLDGAGRSGAEPRTAATFIAAAAGVQLEMLVQRLFVNGQNAMGALNDSLATILPHTTGLRVQDVPITQAFIDQTLAMLRMLQATRSDAVLDRFADLLATVTPGTVTAALQAVWTSADQVQLFAIVEAVALGDSAQIDGQLSAARKAAEGQMPIVSFAASRNAVKSGETTMLTWSSADAVRCHGSGAGGWNGRKDLAGNYVTAAMTQTTTFSLSCSNASGTTARSVVVTVDGVPPQDDPEDPPPAPAPEPTPASVRLTATPAIVDLNGSSTLNWSSEGVTSCAASGGWSGTRPVSGSASVGPLTRDTTFSLSCTGPGGSAVAMTSVSVRIATLTWQAPERKVDGSRLDNLAGFRIHYGTVSRQYATRITISDATRTSHVLSLPRGTYYFAMTAFDANGEESAFSNEVLKRID
jgi:hypothetical protein